MPIYPITRCITCDSAIQMDSVAVSRELPTFRLGDKLAYSLGMDSDEFDKYCRGQGRFYAARLATIYTHPVMANHFNFSGTFLGQCCYCALGDGLCPQSFREVGCYQCKRRLLVVTEFSKLKQLNPEGKSTWETCGWGGLSDALIELILKMVVGEKTKLKICE